MGNVEKTVTVAERSAAGHYRHDLDGLRGVAIALVVVFHIWFGRVSGGVDVFLVLSGFFFTGLLLRRAESGSVSVAFTIRRTARRLLPAMVVVLAAVAAATVLMRPYTQWSDIAAQSLASMFYYQNWQLALTWSDYLAADPSVSPLQHLWSMSVQGQFYLAILLIVAGTAWATAVLGRARSLRPILATLLGALAMVSFGYAVIGTATQQGWNYYDSFARAWELLVGALLALAAPYLTPHRAIQLLLAVAGLSLVVLCGWLVDGASSFPGAAALLPVGATVALILAGNNLAPAERPLPSRMLASRPAVLLGELAYPLYLWHWPLLIFYLAERGQSSIGLRGGLIVLGASLGLAWATHRWIEQPLRLRPRAVTTPVSVRYRRHAGRMVAAVTVVVVGSTGAWQIAALLNPPRPAGELDQALYPGAEALVSGLPVPQAKMRPSVLEAPAEVPYPTRDGCIADWDTRDVVTCAYGDLEAERTLAVVGNSHAEHWVPALRVLAEEHRFRITVYLKMGCPLTIDDEAMYKGEANSDCRDWSRDVIDRLGRDRPDWVFTTATRPIADGGDETPDDYLRVWSALSEHGLATVAIRDTPWLRRNGIRYRATDCLARRGTPTSCGIPRDLALAPVNPALEPAAAFPGVFPIDLTDAVCEPEVCPAQIGNILVYHDEHHLTTSYSRSLAPALGRELQPILGWW